MKPATELSKHSAITFAVLKRSPHTEYLTWESMTDSLRMESWVGGSRFCIIGLWEYSRSQSGAMVTLGKPKADRDSQEITEHKWACGKKRTLQDLWVPLLLVPHDFPTSK